MPSNDPIVIYTFITYEHFKFDKQSKVQGNKSTEYYTSQNFDVHKYAH